MMLRVRRRAHITALALLLIASMIAIAWAQVPPSPAEQSRYAGLLAAAARGDAAEIRTLTASGASPDVRDGYQRTPLHVAAYNRHHEAMRALAARWAGRYAPATAIASPPRASSVRKTGPNTSNELSGIPVPPTV